MIARETYELKRHETPLKGVNAEKQTCVRRISCELVEKKLQSPGKLQACDGAFESSFSPSGIYFRLGRRQSFAGPLHGSSSPFNVDFFLRFGGIDKQGGRFGGYYQKAFPHCHFQAGSTVELDRERADFDIRQKRGMSRQYAQVTESPGYRDTLHIIAEDCSLEGYYFERVCSRQRCYPF